MTWFEIRVELHGCDDYDDIHETMKRLGAERTITADSGDEFELPRATYFYQTDWTDEPEEVRDHFEPSVANAWPTFSLLVGRTDKLAWHGLRPVSKARILSSLLGR